MKSEKILNILNKLEVKEQYISEFENLKKELQADILTSGKVNAGLLTTFKKYVKENEKAGCVKFTKIYKTQRGNYCFTNGYILIDFGNNVENVPAEIRGYIDETDTTSTLDFEGLSDKYATKEIEININELEKYIKYNQIRRKELKNDVKLPLPFEFDKVFINPELIINTLKIIDKKLDKIKVNYNISTSPIQFKIDSISIIVLPIRIQKDILGAIQSEKENFENLMNR